MEPQSLYQYLENHKCKKGQQSTHTRIPNRDLGIYAGSYSFDSDDENFVEAYIQKVFKNKQQEYLTETQLPVGGPILVDFDFRYSTEIEDRQHTDDHLMDIIELYLQTLHKKIIDISETSFPVFIFEKPNVNTLDDVTKDGIHMIIGINLHHEAQMILREHIIKDIGNILEDLPLKNDYESVLDKGISTGKTNWQVYGSRKPGNEAYKLVKYYSVKYDKDDNDFEWEELMPDNINHKEIFELVSARKKNNIKFPLKNNVLERCKKVDSSKAQSKKRIKLRNIKFKKNHVKSSNLPKNMEELQQLVENNLLMANCNDDLYEVREVHQFTMALGDFRSEDREEWFKVGLALHQCNNELLFGTWMLFSSKSEKFDFGDIPAYWENYWNGDFDVQRGSVLTRASIMWWCKQDNPGEYINIKEGTVDYFINKTIANEKPPDYDIAGILHKMYGDQYKCVSIKNNKWYEMVTGRWSEIDSGTTLRKKLSSQLSVKYTQKQKEILQRFHAIDEPFSSDLDGESKDKDEEAKKDQERKDLQKTARRVADISLDLRRTTHKNNIMKESKEWFFDKNFMEKLDANPLLLCFKNGIIDFKEKVFRPSKPDDYVSLCTNIDYIEIDDTNPEHIEIMEEITTFMKKIFPEDPINKYMWQFLASSLRGTNENQIFTIMTGTGRNGKSKLMELMAMTLGDYKGTVPITLITNKRQVIGGASPEIAQLKGIRLAIMQEPSENMQINEGIMKELTGGDPLSGRALYCDTVTFTPQFSLGVCTNHLFDVKSTDDGTWRRIRVCDFQSKFLDKPYENPDFPRNKFPYQFKKEANIDSKFEKWAPFFASMLVKIAFEKEGMIDDCPSVMASSQKYKLQQNYFEQFYEERLVESASSIVKRKDMYNEFNLWYSELYGGKIPKGKDLYEFMEKKLGKIDSRGRFKGWRLIHSFEDELDVTPNCI